MGSSASTTANGDGTVTVDNSLVEEHRRQFSELENKLKEAENLNNNLKSKNYISERLLLEERENSSLLRNRVEQLVTETSRLETELVVRKIENLININVKSIDLSDNNGQLRATNDTLQTSNTATTSEMIRLKTQIADHQKTIEELTKQIKETEQRLTQETDKADQIKRMLDNERKQNKDSEQAFKKQCTEVKVQNDQLQRELAQIKKTKLFSIEAMLDDLHKRVDAISNEILKSAKNNNREKFTPKFQTLKDENDRLIKDLTTVSFTKRLYKSHHDVLLKLHDETDKTCMGSLKTIHELTRDCKKLINDYNTSNPDSFLKAIADHNRACDVLEKVDFSSVFAKEEAMQDTILSCLSNEKYMLEGILNAEKSNNHNNQVGNEKPSNVNHNNVNHINNLDSKQTYDLVVYNMVEASDHYSDIVSFETFMQTVTGRKMKLLGVQRFGVQCKTPRTAKITFNSYRDYEDVLNSNFERYGRIRVEKFYPNRKKAKKNVNN